MDSFELFLQHVGRRIRELRKARHWTQEELAHRAGISRTYMGTVELGAKEPSLRTLFRVAHAMEVALVELFVPLATARPQAHEVVARLSARLLEKGRTGRELRKVEELVDTLLRK
ncbi:MAG: helix-turn-helix transcriptional regulator [Planctomycetes bacterium]|nr:helix-turn-helix transcriptional regulator [Planctomycetota bacterium]